ncbi:Lactonase, 7-bladed beta-propeller-domain-containing protein, partial [Crepidotus variabilis]
LAGGLYSAFVSTYVFDNVTNTLTFSRNSPTGQSPSWITLDPRNRSHLYAINDQSTGALQAYTIDSQGYLSSPTDTISSGGDGPAHAAVLSSGAVAVVNYNSGTGRIIPTQSNGLKFDTSASTLSFPRGGNVSHPHQIVEYNDELLIPDLGEDTIWRLRKGSNNVYSIQGSIPQPTGSGPRHIAINNERLFVLHELASTLSVSDLPASPSAVAQTFASVSIVAPNPPAGSKWQAAEILIPPTSNDFPTPYIYVSNRNTGSPLSQTPGDSIAIFEHVNKGQANEGLKLINQVYTGLEQIRGMQFSASGDYLVASGVVGTGGVIMFQRTDGGRNLVKVASNTNVPTRTSFIWL